MGVSLLLLAAAISVAVAGRPEGIHRLSQRSVDLVEFDEHSFNSTAQHGTGMQSIGGVPSKVNFVHHGGPIIANVDIHPVFWSAAVRSQDVLLSLYCDLPQSYYFNITAQYGVGYGTLPCKAGLVLTNAPLVTEGFSYIHDRDIQSTLATLISIGQLPAPTSNTYYPVHFPPGVTINDGRDHYSCRINGFCGYHETFTLPGLPAINYAVLPDHSEGKCSLGGCGSSTTVAATHELMESVTDPTFSAWYSATSGQIGDICLGLEGAVTVGQNTYAVQPIWSSAAAACTSGSNPNQTAIPSDPIVKILYNASMATKESLAKIYVTSHQSIYSWGVPTTANRPHDRPVIASGLTTGLYPVPVSQYFVVNWINTTGFKSLVLQFDRFLGVSAQDIASVWACPKINVVCTLLWHNRGNKAVEDLVWTTMSYALPVDAENSFVQLQFGLDTFVTDGKAVPNSGWALSNLQVSGTSLPANYQRIAAQPTTKPLKARRVAEGRVPLRRQAGRFWPMH